MTTPVFETLLYTVDDGIAIITMNRPHKLNAFTGQMMSDMIKAFDTTDADDQVKAVIITGSGRAFCAGADLSSGGDTFNYSEQGSGIEEIKPEDVHRDGGGLLTLRIFDSLKPVISAINGPAVGVGATMTLATDFRLASKTARFGFVFARRGIAPDAASSWFLPRIVGISTALKWAYSGRVFDAEEALQEGLVSALYEPEALLDAARTLAHEISDHSAPVSVALTRQLMWRMLGADHPMEAHKADSRAVQYRGRANDAREGVSSFLEKRTANYPDRVSKDLPNIWTHSPPPTFA